MRIRQRRKGAKGAGREKIVKWENGVKQEGGPVGTE